MATNQEELPNLVRASKLQAIFRPPTLTIHLRNDGERQLQSHGTWVFERYIGHGGYGVVYLERKQYNGQGTAQLRAVKFLAVEPAQSSSRQYARELLALATFSSDSKYRESFVQFYCWYENARGVYISTEFCPLGDLKTYLKTKGPLPEIQAKSVALQVLGGLSLMHEISFAHRDLKPANILITSCPPYDWVVKLCDLGLTKRVEEIVGTTSSTKAGTVGFQPPEKLRLVEGVKIVDHYLADMWNLGETIFHTLTGRGSMRDLGELVEYSKGIIPFPVTALIDAGVSPAGIHFITSVMAVNPSKRLTAMHGLQHPWMRAETMLDHTSFQPFPARESFPQNVQSPGHWFPSVLNPTQLSGGWTRTLPNRPYSPYTRPQYPPRQVLPDSGHYSTQQGFTTASGTWTTATDRVGDRDEPSSPLPEAQPTREGIGSGGGRPNYKPTTSSGQPVLADGSGASPLSSGITQAFLEFRRAETRRVRNLISNRKKFDIESRREVLEDLKAFGTSFQLATPIPEDMLFIVPSNPTRQEEAQKESREKSEDPVPIRSPGQVDHVLDVPRDQDEDVDLDSSSTKFLADLEHWPVFDAGFPEPLMVDTGTSSSVEIPVESKTLPKENVAQPEDSGAIEGAWTMVQGKESRKSRR